MKTPFPKICLFFGSTQATSWTVHGLIDVKEAPHSVSKERHAERMISCLNIPNLALPICVSSFLLHHVLHGVGPRVAICRIRSYVTVGTSTYTVNVTE